jgi:hypothetical protein
MNHSPCPRPGRESFNTRGSGKTQPDYSLRFDTTWALSHEFEGDTFSNTLRSTRRTSVGYEYNEGYRDPLLGPKTERSRSN